MRTKKGKLGFLFNLALAATVMAAGIPANRAGAAGVVGDGTAISCTEASLTAALADGGLVTFDCGSSPVTIVFTCEKSITQPTSLDGGEKVILSGGDGSRLFTVSGGGSLEIIHLTLSHGKANQGGAIFASYANVTLTHSTLSNNYAVSQGGAIYSNGNVWINDSTLSNNTAESGDGGGIYNLEFLSISGSSFYGNTAQNGGGGAILNYGALFVSKSSLLNNSAKAGGALATYSNVFLTRSNFIGNSSLMVDNFGGFGGAIWNAGSIQDTGSSFQDNTANVNGAAINNMGQVQLAQTIFVGNDAQGDGLGGCIYNEGLVTGNGCAFANNTAVNGGGIYNLGTLSLSGCAFWNNTARNEIQGGLGGGVYHGRNDLTVTNSTFSANAGGGIHALGPVAVLNSTLYANTAGGLINAGSSAFTLKNTIIAGNTPTNCNGTVSSSKYSISSDNSCALTGPGDMSNTDPKLSGLGNYGGPTPVHMLLTGSPAIDGVAGTEAPATDQRGLPRPIGAGCDIGAVERQITDSDLAPRLHLPLIRQ